jgi:hypothetical protein
MNYLPMKGRGGNTTGIELDERAAAASSGPKVMLSWLNRVYSPVSMFSAAIVNGRLKPSVNWG